MMTKEYAKECFSYDAETGLLYWKQRPMSHFSREHREHTGKSFNSTFAGKVAGAVKEDKRNKYYRLSLDGKKYYAHRIIWLLVYGECPKYIDHIDGNGLNNKLSNLRAVTNQDNCKNARLSKNNKSGISGVVFNADQQRWHARITLSWKRKHLGSFDDFFEACCARKSAESKNGFSERHGSMI